MVDVRDDAEVANMRLIHALSFRRDARTGAAPNPFRSMLFQATAIVAQASMRTPLKRIINGGEFRGVLSRFLTTLTYASAGKPMQLVERHAIKRSHLRFEAIDAATFAAKHLTLPAR